jgi:hypothetical protein
MEGTDRWKDKRLIMYMLYESHRYMLAQFLLSARLLNPYLSTRLLMFASQTAFPVFQPEARQCARKYCVANNP